MATAACAWGTSTLLSCWNYLQFSMWGYYASKTVSALHMKQCHCKTLQGHRCPSYDVVVSNCQIDTNIYLDLMLSLMTSQAMSSLLHVKLWAPVVNVKPQSVTLDLPSNQTPPVWGRGYGAIWPIAANSNLGVVFQGCLLCSMSRFMLSQ